VAGNQLYVAIFVISAHYFSRTDVARNWLGVITIAAFVGHWWMLHFCRPAHLVDAGNHLIEASVHQELRYAPETRIDGVRRRRLIFDETGEP